MNDKRKQVALTTPANLELTAISDKRKKAGEPNSTKMAIIAQLVKAQHEIECLGK